MINFQVDKEIAGAYAAFAIISGVIYLVRFLKGRRKK